MARKRARAKPASADAAGVEPTGVEPTGVEPNVVEPTVAKALSAEPTSAAPATMPAHGSSSAPVPAEIGPAAGDAAASGASPVGPSSVAVVVARGRSIAGAVRARALPAGRAFAAWFRTRLVPATLALARRIGVLAAAAWRRIGPGLRRVAAGARATAQRVWARLDSRGRVAVLGGAGSLVVLIVVAVSLRPGGAPSESQPTVAPTSGAVQPTLSPGEVAALVGDVLPTPTTTDTVLLVTDTASLSASEQAWLSDLRGRLGNVDPVAYREVTLERLREYFVVFVIDRSDALDPAVLAAAHEAGLAIHLIGPAAAYHAQVTGTAQ